MPFNRLNHSILGEIRPRFTLRINQEPEKAITQLLTCTNMDKTITAARFKQTVFIKIPSWLQHYWSPEMTVRIEKSEFSGDILVNCLIGPRQSVWAMFALIYAAILLATSFGGMFGIVQYSVEGSSYFIWLIPIGLILFFTIFISAKVGQRKGRDEMLHLVSFLYHSLNEIGTVERIEKKLLVSDKKMSKNPKSKLTNDLKRLFKLTLTFLKLEKEVEKRKV